MSETATKKELIKWTDEDEAIFRTLEFVKGAINGEFTPKYKKFMKLSRRRTKFKIQEIKAGRKLKYK